MDVLTQIIPWVLASVVASIVAGFYMGRASGNSGEQRLARQQRDSALNTLVELLRNVKELTTDVDNRSSEMREVRQRVGDLNVPSELEEVRQVLLDQVISVMESNQKLEEDLQFARCRMEQQAEELDRTRREAHTDVLSGVANRKAFDDKLRLLLGYHRREGEPFVLILADLDHFKRINDTYGHQSGDRVLNQLGALLLKCVREGDFVARYGGDEFAVLLPRAELPKGLEIANRLRVEATRKNYGVASSTEQTAVTLSFGVAAIQTGDTSETIFQRADQALYCSKNRGRNQVSVPDDSPEDRSDGEYPTAANPMMSA